MLSQPLHGRLRADLVDARHVVDCVTDQRQVIDDPVRRDAELGNDAGDVEPLIAHGVDQRDPVVHQLCQVLVAGGDDHLVTGGRAHPGQRTDGVVGFDAGHLQHRPAQQAHHFVDGGDLGAQVVGHGRALGLVLVVPGIAEGGAMGVEDAGGMAAGAAADDLLTQPLHHRDQTVDGAGGEAVGAPQVRHGVVRPVQVAGSVDQQQRGQGVVRIAHAWIVVAAGGRTAASAAT